MYKTENKLKIIKKGYVDSETAEKVYINSVN